jgi:AraC-like DNA-binding protein
VGLTRAHFGKVFSDEQGLSPLAYRREYRGNAAVSSQADRRT